MKVLIIPSWYVTKDNPISGSFFREQAIALQKAGIDVIVAYVELQPLRKISPVSSHKIIRYIDEGITTYIYTTPAYASGTLGIRFSRCVHAYKHLLHYIKKAERNIDLIHAHSFSPGGYSAVKLKPYHRLPVILTEHSSYVQGKKLTEKEIRNLKYTVEQCDTVICVSEALKQAIEDLCNTQRQIHVIPNIVSSAFSLNDTMIQASVFRFISVGYLIPRKRHQLTIKAFHEAFNCGENVTLDIIGTGEQGNILKKLIADLNEEDRIHLLGQRNRSEVAAELRRSHAFVLASEVETFGVVYVEATASGLPVIGTHNGGFDSIYKESMGVIVDVDEINQLRDAMRHIYDHYSDYDRTRIAAETQAQYGEKVVVDEIIRTYQQVLKKYK